MKLICILLILLGVSWQAFGAKPGYVTEERPILLEVSSEGIAAKTNGKNVFQASFESSGRAHSSDAFALRMGRLGEGKPPSITVNGSQINVPAIRGEDDWFVLLPRGVVRDGLNEVTLRSAAGGVLGLEEVSIFGLLDASEEAHFAMFFGDPKVFDQPAKHPSQDQYDVLHADIDHRVANINSRNLEGTTTITARCTAGGLQTVALDFNMNEDQMTIHSIDNGGDPIIPLAYDLDYSYHWILVTLPAPLSVDDEFTIRVNYSGLPYAEGSFTASPYNAVMTNGSPIVYTLSQPYGARTWWPCKDIPEDKFTADIHVTLPEEYTAVSNGTLISTESVGLGEKQWTWQESYPIASYLVSIACSEYVQISDTYTALDGETTMPVSLYVLPANVSTEQDGLIGTKEAMTFFADTFGEYPFLEEKYVTATMPSSGMEHQTCTSIATRALDNEGRDWLNIHELAHQWFGDYVTLEHYDHLWLNEGFATYLEALYYEYRGGPAQYHQYINNRENRIVDGIPLVDSSADSFSYGLVYVKGNFVLHMLRHVLGDEKFFQGCRDYLQAAAYGTVLTEDLQAAMEAQYGDSLDWFFDQWVYGTGRPTYRYGWSSFKSAQTSSLNLTIEQTQSGDAFEMPIDIVVHTSTGEEQLHVVWNDQKSQSYELDLDGAEAVDVEFDPDNWVLKNMQSIGIPTLLTMESGGDRESARVTWNNGGETFGGYRILLSPDGEMWSLAADENSISGGMTEYTLIGLDPSDDYYVALQGVTPGGAISAQSDRYGWRSSSTSKVLIVDGLDREISGRPPTHAWAVRHGLAIDHAKVGFDTCANESVIDGTIVLNDYAAVVWMLGEESTTVDHSFNTTERSLVRQYLDGGGKLFVTGAEVLWDLQYRNVDESFCTDYLKANYVSDDSLIYTAYGVTGSLFDGLSFTYDDGSGDSYYADYPEVFEPINGSDAVLRYDESMVAGTAYKGTFGTGTETGAVIYIGFGFETIQDVEVRNEIMKRVLGFMDLESEPSPNGFFFY